MSKYIRWSIFFALTLLVAPPLLVRSATASLPEICGNGYDDDGSGGDLPCAGMDQDQDGHYSVSDGGDDCDDNNYKIYPGVALASGCSTGQWRRCQTNGTYTSCSSSTLCEATGSGTCKYIDCVNGSDSTGNGSFSNPWKTFRMIGSQPAGSKPSGWYQIYQGDVIYLKGSGTCSDTYNPGPGYNPMMLHILNVGGTSSNPITIKRYPGDTAVLDPPFTSGTPGTVIRLDSANYIKLEDLDITGSYSSPLYITGPSTNIEIARVYCHDTQGSALDNIACINSSSTQNLFIHHNDFSNVYDAARVGNENISLVVFFGGTGNRFEYNRLHYTNSPSYGGSVTGLCYKYKHKSAGGPTVIRGNQFWNCRDYAVQNSSENILMDHNLFVNPSEYAGVPAYTCDDAGGAGAKCRDTHIEYNTFINMRPIQIQTSGVNSDTGMTYVSKNVFVDNSASYGSENKFYRIARYGSNTQYNQFRSAGGLVSSENCFYNSASASLTFDFFEDTTSGNLGGSKTMSQWQELGYDRSTNLGNPSLDTSLRGAATSCRTRGWRRIDPPECSMYLIGETPVCL